MWFMMLSLGRSLAIMAVMTTCATTWTSASPFPTDRRTTSSWWEVVFAESPQEPPQPPVTGAITSGTSAVEASPIGLPVRPSPEGVDEAHTNANPMSPSMTPNTEYQPGLLRAHLNQDLNQEWSVLDDGVPESWKAHIPVLKALDAECQRSLERLKNRQSLIDVILRKYTTSSTMPTESIEIQVQAEISKIVDSPLQDSEPLPESTDRSKNMAPQPDPNIKFSTTEHKFVQLRELRDLQRKAGLIATEVRIVAAMLKFYQTEITDATQYFESFQKCITYLKKSLEDVVKFRSQGMLRQADDAATWAATVSVTPDDVGGKIEALGKQLAALTADSVKAELAKNLEEITTSNKKTFASDQGTAGTLAAEIEQLEAKYTYVTKELAISEFSQKELALAYQSSQTAFKMRVRLLVNRSKNLLVNYHEKIVGTTLRQLAGILHTLVHMFDEVQSATLQYHANEIRILFETSHLAVLERDLTTLQIIALVVPNDETQTVGHERDSNPQALRDAAAAWWKGELSRKNRDLQRSGGPMLRGWDELNRVSNRDTAAKNGNNLITEILSRHDRYELHQNFLGGLAQLKLPKHF
ncbi:hypothetical protein CXG81DRAFT_19860 [Caulochytrium protostelioides]|uniref:Secreted protein n=1 Tax=Caulochytrium protostelioides TaxID=1555241 RepID=A0A4P9X544_9FUNG|nr:hypothetical protein CXG81DRAFT_19860 [Caulochytrium protostelioides]|eukprot:RKP00130.1 hypothetical protein CXG81DRAFT_19860 [Caulochytrium protostelioides]